MSSDTKELRTEEKQKSPPAGTGNASNPAPHNDSVPATDNQLLDEKAETYLREAANIEDMPDPKEEQDAEDEMENKINHM